MNPKDLINTQTQYGSKAGILCWLNKKAGFVWAYMYKLDRILPILIKDLRTTEEQIKSIPYEHKNL